MASSGIQTVWHLDYIEPDVLDGNNECLQFFKENEKCQLNKVLFTNFVYKVQIYQQEK